MTGALLAGCLLLAYGPSAVLLLSYISRRSALLILSIIAAFVWLLAILGTSIVWIAVVPLKKTHGFTVVIGVLFQEAARLLMLRMYMRGERTADGMVKPGGAKLFNDLAAAIAMGFGFGAMHTLMAYGALLATAGGDEAFYLETCPQLSVFTSSAAVALLYNALHIVLTVLALDALRRGQRALALLPCALHLAFALLTLLNESTLAGACTAMLPALAAVLVAACVLAARIVRAPDYSGRRQVRAWAAANAEALSAAASARAAAAQALEEARRRRGRATKAGGGGGGGSGEPGEAAVDSRGDVRRRGGTVAALPPPPPPQPQRGGWGAGQGGGGGGAPALHDPFDIDSAGFGGRGGLELAALSRGGAGRVGAASPSRGTPTGSAGGGSGRQAARALPPPPLPGATAADDAALDGLHINHGEQRLAPSSRLEGAGAGSETGRSGGGGSSSGRRR